MCHKRRKPEGATQKEKERRRTQEKAGERDGGKVEGHTRVKRMRCSQELAPIAH